MIVGFLKEFADAEEAVGNTTGATALRTRATELAASVNKYLWDNDHYVTQVRSISRYLASAAFAHSDIAGARADVLTTVLSARSTQSTWTTWTVDQICSTSATVPASSLLLRFGLGRMSQQNQTTL